MKLSQAGFIGRDEERERLYTCRPSFLYSSSPILYLMYYFSFLYSFLVVDSDIFIRCHLKRPFPGAQHYRFFPSYFIIVIITFLLIQEGKEREED